MRQLLTLLVVVGTVCMPAFAQNGSRLTTPAAPAVPEYIIGPEDVLEINVWHEADLTRRATVRPDGKIGLPLLNEIQAAGLTPKQLQESISEGIKKFISSGPSVAVIVSEIKSHVAYVTGAVGKPGPYVLGSPVTIVELLIRAGGLAEFAKAEEIQILRKEGNNETRRLRFNYKHFMEGRDYQQNIPIRTGDIIFVP